MKSFALILLCLALCLPALVSCGDKPSAQPDDTAALPADSALPDGIAGPTVPEELEYRVDLSEYITLPDYENADLGLTPLTVTDEDVQIAVDQELAAAGTSSAVTDRGAEQGDTVEYLSTGVRLDTGETIETSESRSITVGSAAYLDGFGDFFIGARPGDTVKFIYTFPDDYFNTEIAGKAVEYSAQIKSIARVTPAALDDDFVRSLEIEGVSTVDEFRDYVRLMMERSTAAQNAQDARDALYAFLEAGCTISGWPEAEYAYYKNICDKTVAAYASVNRITEEAYIAQTYGSRQGYDKYVEDYCSERLTRDMIAFSLVRKYGVRVDPQEYADELRYGFDHYGASYGVTDLAVFEERFGGDLTMGLLLKTGLDAALADRDNG